MIAGTVYELFFDPQTHSKDIIYDLCYQKT